MRKILLAATLSIAALSAGVAAAQDRPVTVGVGPQLQQKSENLGRREVDGLRKDLGDEVSRVIAKGRSGIVRADLVLEDAQPNRPTFDQLSRTSGLSMRSVGVGGARVSGTVTMADGSIRPLRYQWYETDLREERAAGTWYDADRSFDYLTFELERGKVPDKYTGPGPSNSGHFGYPFNGE